MELILFAMYAGCAWLVFFKFKWLPWNFITQVITITIPIVAITLLILVLNIVAPSSADIRVINYVVPINPQVAGIVTEVPIEPNKPIKKGEVLFRVNPVPYQLEVDLNQAKLDQLKVQLITAQANQRGLNDQLTQAVAEKNAVQSKLGLVRQRVVQYKSLASTGAGNKFDYEQAQADAANLKAELDSATASEAQVRAKLSAKSAKGEQDEVASTKAEIISAEAALGTAKWRLEQTVYYAPSNGRVVSLALRPGAMAVNFPAMPAMTFVEDEQWILAIFKQNEVRKIKPGQEAEVAFKMIPGRVIKCKVDSVMWATAQGQLPIGGASTSAGIAPIPPSSLAVRLLVDKKDKDVFLASGATGGGAVYTDSVEIIQILRRVLIRISAKLDWLILKLH
ncbi:MAG: HlyD family secretion protein [Arenimonas sp.]|nr:HlyD family secretion protein [Arenimonas sp.]